MFYRDGPKVAHIAVISTINYREVITCWQEDMNFMFEWQEQ